MVVVALLRRSRSWCPTISAYLGIVVLLSSLRTILCQDSLCFLKDGRPSESFTVSETLPIGSLVGSLNIIGDPAPNGNIILELVEGEFKNFLEIKPGTKNLVLKKKLDKENVEGPNHLNVTIRCDKKDSNDLSIPVPVKIFVEDANDNSPVFIGTPYTITVGEVTSVGMKVSQGLVKAIDRDQPGPFSTVQYSVETGPYSEFLAFEIPLEGILILNSSLDYEKLPNFTVTIKAQDLGNPPLSNTTVLNVVVLDADDQNPKFSSDAYFAVVPENNIPGAILHIDPDRIHAEDQDVGFRIPLKYSLDSTTSENSYFQIDEQTGEVALKTSVPDEVAFPVTLVLRATQTNNPDRYALAPLTVTRTNSLSRLRFLQSSFELAIPENAATGQPILRLHTNRPYDETLVYSLDTANPDQFGINNSGELLLKKPLDFETEEKYTLRAIVTAGKLREVCVVNISVLDVNEHDPHFTYDQYHFQVTVSDLKNNTSIGKVVVSDGDRNDKVSLRIMGALASAFTIDDNGFIRVKNLSRFNTSTAHLVVVARDDGHPPRQTSIPLIISIPENAMISESFLSVNSAFFLMILFGVLLGVLFLVIVMLAVYLVKYKQKREKVGHFPTYPNHQPISKMASYVTGGIPHQKLNQDGSPRQDNAARVGVANPIFQGSPNEMQRHTECNCDIEVSGDDGSEDSSNSSHVLHENGGHGHGRGCGWGCSSSSDHTDCQIVEIHHGGMMESNGGHRPSSMKFRSKSIPKRVKKLSWEDERNKQASLDPDVSVTPMPTQQNNEQPELTVYF